MNHYKLSVITVCYNSVQTIEKTLISIYEQSYKNIEHIIIDGASTDGTLDIIEKYKDKYASLVSEKDNGIYHAMNKGIEASSGDILFFLNSDDYFSDREIVEEVMQQFIKDPFLELLFGNQSFYDSNELRIMRQNPISGQRNSIATTTVLHQSIFAKRHVFNLTKGFSEKYKIVSDFEWMIKSFVVFNCRNRYINRIISVIGKEGLSNTTPFEKERNKVMKKYYSCYEIFKLRILPLKKRAIKTLYHQTIKKIISSPKSNTFE